MFARAIGDHGRVGTPEELGIPIDPPASLVVVRNPEVGGGLPGLVAVIDLSPKETPRDVAAANAPAWARQGVEEYWQLRFADGVGDESIEVWRNPAPDGARYGSFQSIMGPGQLRLTPFPDASIDYDAVFPRPCGPSPPLPTVSAGEWEQYSR